MSELFAAGVASELAKLKPADVNYASQMVEALLTAAQECGASDLHLQLDCDLDAATGLVRVDRNQQTSVPGIYAAGDLTPNSQLAVVAAAEGALAAIQIHKSLLSAEHTIED